VRVGVARLDDTLGFGQIGALVDVVVAVAGPLREERPEDPQEVLDAVVAPVEAPGEALLEVAGGGVDRAVERALVTAQQVPGLGGEAALDVDQLVAGARDEAQNDLRGGRGRFSLLFEGAGRSDDRANPGSNVTCGARGLSNRRLAAARIPAACRPALATARGRCPLRRPS